MKISKTINYDLTFSVCAHWGEEGGMGFESFAYDLDTLLEALSHLEHAQKVQPERDWEIVVNVLKSVVK